MNRQGLKPFAEDLSENQHLVVVTNREPYLHKLVESGLKVERPVGGLTSALDAVMKVAGGTWVAWGSGSGDRQAGGRIEVPPEHPQYGLRRVWLPPALVDSYYHGYSNQVLWPLCHMTLDRVYFRRRFWEAYGKANALFADAVVEEAPDAAAVWIHDYHLCLLPELLRKRRPDLVLAHFWHIPWPGWSIFRTCPQAAEILECLLGNDLVGFQIPLFARNFMECIRRGLGVEVREERGTVRYKGRTVRVQAYPISVDFRAFEGMAAARRTVRLMPAIRKRHGLGNRRIGIGVDRLEYTKALLKRLQALDLFFERFKKYRGVFTFIQIAVPTRMREPYVSYKRAVEEIVDRINARYGTPGWTPILYLDTKIEHEDLVAYYRLADVAVISSIYDGMNLVAKEYIASRSDGDGALLLSGLAGAAEELHGAVTMNPYDLEAFAERMRDALEMVPEERRCRMAALRRQVREHDIHRWVSDILGGIGRICAEQLAGRRIIFDHFGEIGARLRGRPPLLFLDYDGTLTPIVDSPERALLPAAMRRILTLLLAHFPVAVVTGRSLSEIKEKVAVPGIWYAGNHGAEIEMGQTRLPVLRPPVRPGRMRELVRTLTEALAPIPGVRVEDKGFTASVHYRAVAPCDLERFFHGVWRVAEEAAAGWVFAQGKKVIEIRPESAPTKADAVNRILRKAGGDHCPIYIGDDAGDAGAFEAVRGKGIGIAVGGSPTAAFSLRSQGEVEKLLRWLLEQAAGTSARAAGKPGRAVAAKVGRAAGKEIP